MFGTRNEKYLVYIDTDSLYYTLDVAFKKFNVSDDKAIKTIEKLAIDKLTPIVNKFCEQCCTKMNSYENRLSFKLETSCSAAIWAGKKRYVLKVHSSEGVTYSQPKFKVKGLEMVRSSTPRFVRDKLKSALDIIFDGDEQKTQAYIAQVRDEFMRLPYDQVAFPRGANNLDEYSDATTIYKKGCPVHVRAALLYNHYLKKLGLTGKYRLITEGSKVKFIYLKTPNKIRENIIAFPVEGELPAEFGVIGNVDYELQFEKTFLAAMSVILDAINWNAIETSSLDEFF